MFGSDSAIPWQAMAEDFDLIRDYIAQAIDGFENFNVRIREAERGFHLYHAARHRVWNTDSGKAQFEVPKYPITHVASQMAEKTSTSKIDAQNAQNTDDSQHSEQKIRS